MGSMNLDCGGVELSFGKQMAQITFDASSYGAVKVNFELDATAVLDISRLTSIHQQHPFRDAKHPTNVFNEFSAKDINSVR